MPNAKNQDGQFKKYIQSLDLKGRLRFLVKVANIHGHVTRDFPRGQKYLGRKRKRDGHSKKPKKDTLGRLAEEARPHRPHPDGDAPPRRREDGPPEVRPAQGEDSGLGPRRGRFRVEEDD